MRVLAVAWSAAFLLLGLAPARAAEHPPIALLRDNPHYFEFRGEPTVLVTSGEHYGAVLNLDFDFIPYLDELAAREFNQTRTFSGTYREVPGSFNIAANTLAPRPGRYQSPWVRVSADDEPERFDLDRFDPQYFERLRAFLTEAGRRGVVVELVLFCPLYEDGLWTVNPMNGRNNVQALPEIPREEVYTLKHEALTKHQMAFVDRVVRELRDSDNLYYEICNEPYFAGVTLEWQRAVAEAITAAEAGDGPKHLIAQNIANDHAVIRDPNPAVSIFNFHYAAPEAALENLGLDRVLGDDETGFDGTADRPYRTEAWLWLLSGGGEFSHLDYSFTPETEAGTAPVTDPTPGGGGPTFRSQLALLKRQVEAMDLRRARPEPGTIRSGVPSGARAAVLAVPGQRYLLYLSDGSTGPELELNLPDGRYDARWIDPRDGAELAVGSLALVGQPIHVNGPRAAEDLVMVLTRRAD